MGFQRSADSSRDQVRFTVNLSVIDRIEWDVPVVTKPWMGKKPSSIIRYGPWAQQTWSRQARIGQLSRRETISGWRVGADGDAETQALLEQEVITDLLQYGIPWLRDPPSAKPKFFGS